MRKTVYFKPDGNDLKRVFYYYGLEFDEKIICPFHDDNHPSCTVNFEEGIFHCFACSASGDAYQFVALANPEVSDLNKLILYHGIINSEKVSKLKLSKTRLSKSKNKKTIDKAYDQEIAYDFYHGLKTTNWKVNKKGSVFYKRYMLKRGFTEQTLNDCGAKLTITDQNYPIVFPMYDMGEFRGYVCRAIDKEVADKRKYLYNKGFSRLDTLVGNYNSEVVVLCEGYMDRLKLTQYGLKHAVAILGWKITSKQIDKLRANGVKTIISALDTDAPGEKGTDYLNNFFDVIRFEFPKGIKDPGDLTKEQFDKAYAITKRKYKKQQKQKEKRRN